MNRYTGIHTLNAKPMTRGDYNFERGWSTPPEENPAVEGYMIQFEDGHITWQPKIVFEKSYRLAGSLEILNNDLLTTKYTTVYHESEFTNNAPHHFEVYSSQGLENPCRLLGSVDFQEGPINEVGINGINNEDLIAMVICRLEHFNQSEYSSRDNAIAITHLEDAMLRLRKRTMGRENRGVEGTSTV